VNGLCHTGALIYSRINIGQNAWAHANSTDADGIQVCQVGNTAKRWVKLMPQFKDQTPS
jgi:hypothetical protein